MLKLNYYVPAKTLFTLFASFLVACRAGKGQFEMAMGYTVCTYAADNLIFTREVIRAVARKHGLLATFMPK